MYRRHQKFRKKLNNEEPVVQAHRGKQQLLWARYDPHPVPFPYLLLGSEAEEVGKRAANSIIHKAQVKTQ